MINLKEAKIGDVLYYAQNGIETIQKFTVDEIAPDSLRMKAIEYCKDNGERIMGDFGSIYINLHETERISQRLFTTPSEAAKFRDKEKHDKYMEYAGKIQNLSDLLRFPLEHCICGEDYDVLAKKVYEDKIAEFVNNEND